MSEPCRRTPSAPGPTDDARATDRRAAAVSLGERFRLLHEQERLITSDLSLPMMIRRIAGSACTVLGAELAVIVALGTEGEVESVVRDGPVSGTDVGLTTLIDDSTSWAELLAHLRAREQPYLERTVDVSGERFGHILVAGPASGRFTPEDDEVFDALSVSAGSSIEHATLFQRAASGVRWLHASGEIARAMLADADIDAFTEIVARAVEAAGADHGLLITPTEEGQLTVLAGHGLIRGRIGATFDPDDSELIRAVVNGKTLRAPDLAQLHTRTSSGTADTAGADHDGPIMLAPLLDALGTRGSVLLVRAPEAQVFTDADLERFAGYTAQVALAMQFAEARVDSERLLRVEASADAARELSDIVMQRLFAVGIGLDTLCENLAGTEHHDKLERHIVDLDRTIDEIRTRVFVSDKQARQETVRFPRILLPVEPAAERASVVKRGRRRSDWRDGSGDVRSSSSGLGPTGAASRDRRR